MGPQFSYTTGASQLADIQRKNNLGNKILGGTNWFYWIAGMSILNSITYNNGSSITFVLGLGATQIIDGLMNGLVRNFGPSWSILRYIGIALDLGIATVFVILGFLGKKGYRWPIYLGMVLYAFDGVILLLFKDYLGAGFHAFALFGIWKSRSSIKELAILEKTGSTESIESLRK